MPQRLGQPLPLRYGSGSRRRGFLRRLDEEQKIRHDLLQRRLPARQLSVGSAGRGDRGISMTEAAAAPLFALIDQLRIYALHKPRFIWHLQRVFKRPPFYRLVFRPVYCQEFALIRFGQISDVQMQVARHIASLFYMAVNGQNLLTKNFRTYQTGVANARFFAQLPQCNSG